MSKKKKLKPQRIKLYATYIESRRFPGRFHPAIMVGGETVFVADDTTWSDEAETVDSALQTMEWAIAKLIRDHRVEMGHEPERDDDE